MAEIRNLTRNGETFYPLACTEGLITRDGDVVGEINDIFDISEYNASGTPLTPAQYSSLSLALAAIPSGKQKGGMTVRYIDSNESIYVQFRLKTAYFSILESNWQNMCLAQQRELFDDIAMSQRITTIVDSALNNSSHLKIFNSIAEVFDVVGYVDQTGKVHNDGNYHCKLIYIACVPGEIFEFTGSKSGDTMPNVVWFDKNFNILSTDSGNKRYATPNQAAFVLFTKWEPTNTNIVLSVTYPRSINNNLNTINTKIRENNANDNLHWIKDCRIVKSSFESIGYINRYGNIQDDGNFHCKFFYLEVNPGEIYVTYGPGGNNETAPRVIWFDKNWTVLSSQYNAYRYTVPDNTAYALFTYWIPIADETITFTFYAARDLISDEDKRMSEINGRIIKTNLYPFKDNSWYTEDLLIKTLDYCYWRIEIDNNIAFLNDDQRFNCGYAFVDCSAGDKFKWNGSADVTGNAPSVVWFDKDWNIISYLIERSGSGVFTAPNYTFHALFCSYVDVSSGNPITLRIDYLSFIQSTAHFNQAIRNYFDLKLNGTLPDVRELTNGYFHPGLYFHKDNNYHCKYAYLACLPNDNFVFTGHTGSNPGIVWYNKDGDIISYSSGGNNVRVVAPANANFVMFTAWKGIAEEIPFSVTLVVPEVIKDQVEDLKSFKTCIHNYENFKAGKNDLLAFERFDAGYVDVNGNVHNDGNYNCKYGYSICFPGEKYVYSGGQSNTTASPGAVWFDKNWNKISTLGGSAFTAIVPDNACFVMFASYMENERGLLANFNVSLGIPDNIIDIICIGDSVTEGMATTGAHYARYGESPYPARLTTLLVDNGYVNTLVKNYGHGGERLQDMAVRLGAWPTIINQDITLPADGNEVSLGTYSLDSYGRVSGTKLELLKKDQYDDDYLVYLTQTSHDTNPIIVNGKSLTMTIHDNTNYLKQDSSDSPFTIKAGSVLFTANNRNADVVIIYIGINGSNSINLETWLDINKRCGEMNGGKYIILGATHSLFNSWSDVLGSTLDEKHAYYSRKCTDTFGLHFIDLYQDFFDRGIEILDKAGMLSQYTVSQLQEINTDMAQRVVPKEFSYNGNSRGNVHLSKEGYHIIGQLLFERLQELNYI